MPELSVIIPVYNVEQYLDRCIESILMQDYHNYEVILVDDGSTDGSVEKCDYYGQKYSNFIVIHKQNGGLGFARNSGLDNASGRIVTFIDSDDYIGQGMFREMVSGFIDNGIDTCYCDYSRVINDTEVPNHHLEGCKGIYDEDEVKNKIIPWVLGGGPGDPYDDIIGCSVCKTYFSMDIINQQHLRFHSEKEMISEDIIFQLDYLRFAKKVQVIDKSFYYYCLNTGTLSTSYRSDRLEKTVMLYYEELKRLDIIGVKSDCISRAQRGLISNARVSIMIAVKGMTFSDALKEIKKIENHDTYKEVLKSFPIQGLPTKQRILATMLKNKYTLGVYALVWVYIKKEKR